MVILVMAGARAIAPIRGSAANGAVVDEVGLMAEKRLLQRLNSGSAALVHPPTATACDELSRA